MKIYKSLIFTILIIISLLSQATFATQDTPTAVADKTVFTSIIPSENHDLEMEKQEITIDFLNENKLDISDQVEKTAKVTMKYEISSDSTSTTTFNLPFISRFLYLPNQYEIKVDDKVITSELLYGELNKGNPNDDIINFNIDNFQNDYQFINDLDGYLYTIRNPETKSEKYYADTSITIDNASNEIKLIDFHSYHKENGKIISYGKIYKSKEIDYFFSNEDVKMSVISEEAEEVKYGYSSSGVLIAPATIEKRPMKLSEYYQFINFDKEYKTSYVNTYRSLFYKTFDGNLNFDSSYNMVDTRMVNMYVVRDYRPFACQFSVDFQANATKIIEISYLAPIYLNRRDFTLEYLPNPQKVWNQDIKTDISIIYDYKIIDSSLNYEKTKNLYSFSNDTDEIVSLKFDYRPVRVNFFKEFQDPKIMFISILLVAVLAFWWYKRKHKKSSQ